MYGSSFKNYKDHKNIFFETLKTKRLSAETIADKNPAFNRILQRPRKEPLTIAKLKKYYQIQGFPI